ncbi:hypothetical protein RFI_28751 [Reticulomyxa filosa]|uniref:Uncharacterized protein n=1 Tax=Reticulomyxa filosa TaxID=46433 RepID=X6M4Q9_RETFI|nr:hypothetical protein RFI_28751 [Reticulomyxa filosa]|eukprot:ETO08636.1 hypothetical protein RFI_28751 [Reticulomyxa filosa]
MSQLEQLSKEFTNIEKELIFKTWNCCKEKFDETIKVLQFITENKTSSDQQLLLMELLERFGNRIEEINDFGDMEKFKSNLLGCIDKIKRLSHSEYQ